MSYPNINHTTRYNPQTNEYELCIDIKFKKDSVKQQTVSSFGFDTKPIELLTSAQLSPYLTPINTSTKPLNESSKLDDVLKTISLCDKNYTSNTYKPASDIWKLDNVPQPALNEDVIPDWPMMTKSKIQSIIDSLEELKKTCII